MMRRKLLGSTILFWLFIAGMGAGWVLTSSRRDQAILLFNGWYSEALGLDSSRKSGSVEADKRLDHQLLERYWIGRDGRAPRALESAFLQYGAEARRRFETVLKPKVDDWERLKREAHQRRPDASPQLVGKEGTRTDNRTQGKTSNSPGGEPQIQISGLSFEAFDGKGLPYHRRGDEASLTVIFPHPIRTSEIGDGLRWEFETTDQGAVSGVWRFSWGFTGDSGFDADRLLLLAPEVGEGGNLFSLNADMRSFPDWIGDKSLEAVRLEWPKGDQTREGSWRGLYRK